MEAGFKTVSVFAEALEAALGGQSQGAFGKRIGKPQQTVGRWLAGLSLPQRDTVVAIAEALDEDPEKWLRLRDQSTIAEAQATVRRPTRRELERVHRRQEELAAEIADLLRRSEQ